MCLTNTIQIVLFQDHKHTIRIGCTCILLILMCKYSSNNIIQVLNVCSRAIECDIVFGLMLSQAKPTACRAWASLQPAAECLLQHRYPASGVRMPATTPRSTSCLRGEVGGRARKKRKRARSKMKSTGGTSLSQVLRGSLRPSFPLSRSRKA